MGLFQRQDQHRDTSRELIATAVHVKTKMKFAKNNKFKMVDVVYVTKLTRSHRIKMTDLKELKWQTVMSLKSACKMTGF